MRQWFATDWAPLFAPQMTLAEIVVRGVLVYGSLCLMLRVVLKRQAGRVSLSDLLVVSVVAGVCRNPLIRDAYSITDGLLVVAMVLLCSYAADWLSYYSPAVHRLLHAPPVPLVRDGQVLHDNLRHELMTESQLRSKLRREGVRAAEDVAEAYMEDDGHVTVIKRRQPGTHCSSPGSERNSPAGAGPGSFAERDTSEPEPECETDQEMIEFVRTARRLERELAALRQRIEHGDRDLGRTALRSDARSGATSDNQ
jgi:uncharacterized membrane protein YcaP (DUF421 family)